MPVPRRFDRQPPERDTTRINERIRVPEVRLIDENGQQVGIMRTQDALRRAQERDLDLVEVAAEAKPPVCRILDYSKYKYEQAQKAKAARKHQQQINVREIKFRPKIAQHDYDTKKGHVERFLKARDKVKVTIMFRGREMAHPERGEMILNRLAEELGELAVVEQRPQQDGRNMTMMLGPARPCRGRARARSPTDARRERAARRPTTLAPSRRRAAAEPRVEARCRRGRSRPSRRRSAETPRCSRRAPTASERRPAQTPARPCRRRSAVAVPDGRIDALDERRALAVARLHLISAADMAYGESR